LMKDRESFPCNGEHTGPEKRSVCLVNYYM